MELSGYLVHHLESRCYIENNQGTETLSSSPHDRIHQCLGQYQSLKVLVYKKQRCRYNQAFLLDSKQLDNPLKSSRYLLLLWLNFYFLQT